MARITKHALPWAVSGPKDLKLRINNLWSSSTVCAAANPPRWGKLQHLSLLLPQPRRPVRDHHDLGRRKIVIRLDDQKSPAVTRRRVHEGFRSEQPIGRSNFEPRLCAYIDAHHVASRAERDFFSVLPPCRGFASVNGNLPPLAKRRKRRHHSLGPARLVRCVRDELAIRRKVKRNSAIGSIADRLRRPAANRDEGQV